MADPRTVRDGREAIAEAEEAVAAIHNSPAAVMARSARWYLRKARLALRQAERALADADDPRLPDLKPLSPQLPRVPRPRRVRYRCPRCFSERLLHPSDEEAEGGTRCYSRNCYGELEPVPRTREPKRPATPIQKEES